MAALLIMTAFCSGNKGEPVKTEPVKPKTQLPQTNLPVEKKEIPPQEPSEKPLERPEELEITPLEEQKPLLTAPANTTAPTPEQAEESQKTLEITDSITTGMTAIFRSFGYSGAVDLPENFKRRVAYYIRYFSENEKGVRFFHRAMVRSEQFLPMIRDVLAKKHLPLSLAYLPLIESGYNINARSRAKAIGLWQFMKGTALMYGLKVTRKLDQRKDPIQSTIAAAEYLNDLLAMFGAEDPFLGICAYNAGEGKILRALRTISYKERSFWTLVKKGILQNETNEYIPRLLAVSLMASEPEKYAAASKLVPMDLKPEEAETEDQEVIASLGSSKDDLVESADETETTPEVVEDSPVEQPQPTQIVITTPKMKPASGNVYKVKRGDTMYSIARSFDVTVKQVKKWNGLKNNRIHVGQKLKISGSEPALAKSERNYPRQSSGQYKLIYTVNYSDSLAHIALFFNGVTARDIMRWNNLRHSRIHPKQKLAIYANDRPKKIRVHVVKRGETAKSIAKKYGVRIEFVLSLNGLLTNSTLKPGKRLNIYIL